MSDKINLTEFEKEVLNLIKKIPKGKVTTYKEIARALGRPSAARAVGNALNRNPHAPRVPCHRVIKSDGSVGGYAFGLKRKKEILEKEGVELVDDRVKNFEKIIYRFPKDSE